MESACQTGANQNRNRTLSEGRTRIGIVAVCGGVVVSAAETLGRCVTWQWHPVSRGSCSGKDSGTYIVGGVDGGGTAIVGHTPSSIRAYCSASPVEVDLRLAVGALLGEDNVITVVEHTV